MIGKVRFSSEHRAARETLKIDHFSVTCYRFSSFWRYLFNLFGIYNYILKQLFSFWYIIKQLFASVSVNSGRYLPRRFPARQKSTTIHLHLSEWLLIIRELNKHPRRRWRQECHKFAYLSTKNNSFARFAWTIFICTFQGDFSCYLWRQKIGRASCRERV